MLLRFWTLHETKKGFFGNSEKSFSLRGAGERTRTAGLLITNQLLCHLSYAGLTWPIFKWFIMQNQEKYLLQALIAQIPNRSSGIDCSGLSGSERAYLAATLHSQLQQPMIVVVPTPKAAELFLEDLNFFSDKSNGQAHYFPPYNMLPFKHLSYHNETAASRIRTLYGLMVSETPPLVVTTIDALLQKIIPKTEISDYAELLIEGEDIDRDRLVEKLVWGGYGRTLIVEEPGEFCVSGGIVDVFSPLYHEPLRIEFFGETDDSLRCFSPETQQTVKMIEDAVIL